MDDTRIEHVTFRKQKYVSNYSSLWNLNMQSERSTTELDALYSNI